jgi:hypothetical protein
MATVLDHATVSALEMVSAFQYISPFPAGKGEIMENQIKAPSCKHADASLV